MKVKSLSRVQLLVTPWTAPTRLLRPWDFPGKSTGVGYHCLLQPANRMMLKKQKLCQSAIFKIDNQQGPTG